MKTCTCVVWLIIHVAVYTRSEGYQNRICPTGYFYSVQCPSGSYITVTSALAAFGELKEPCYTSTVYCTSVYTQGALLEFNGNLEAFVKDECENKDKCSFTVDSAWQSSCNNKEYNVVYLDVEYGCKGNTTSTTGFYVLTTMTTATTTTQLKYTGSFSSSNTTTTRITKEGSANTTSASVARPIWNEMVSSGTNDADVVGKEDLIPLWYTIVGVLVVLFIISLVLVAVCVRRKRKRRRTDSDDNEIHISRTPNDNQTTLSPYEAINLAERTTHGSLYTCLPTTSIAAISTQETVSTGQNNSV